MLPGRVYSPASIAALLWRRKWLIMLPVVVGASAAVLYSARQPNQYQAETLILVVPQRVPESFVRATVTMRIEDRLRTISQQILSRTRLEQIIEEFNLYPDLRQTRPLDDVVADMRDSVQIAIVRGDSFRLSYTYTEPTATMQVTDRLARDFIVDNTRERQSQAEGTSQFLEAQLEDARRRLIEQEKRLETYRRIHAGELPSQLPSNMQAIQNAQLQLQALHDSVSRDRDRRVVVERLLADLSIAPILAPPATANVPAMVQLPIEAQLDLARQTVTELVNRGLTTEHPDLRAAERRVVELSAKVEAERATHRNAPPPATNAADAARRNQMTQLTAERENLDGQIAAKAAEDERLRRLIAGYQSRIEAVPTRESELTELTRDYDTVQTTYRSLLAKKEESQIATNLENRQSPFPVVTVGGRVRPTGTKIDLLAVRAPQGSRVSVRCRGKRCRLKPLSKVVGRGRLRLKAAERLMPAGVALEVLVRRGDRIGKFTRLKIRQNARPRRTDGCLWPGTAQLAPCPDD